MDHAGLLNTHTDKVDRLTRLMEAVHVDMQQLSGQLQANDVLIKKTVEENDIKLKNAVGQNDHELKQHVDAIGKDVRRLGLEMGSDRGAQRHFVKNLIW